MAGRPPPPPATRSSAHAPTPPGRAEYDFPDDPFSGSNRGQHGGAGPSAPQERPQESLADWAKNTRFTVLNHFSQVTNVARNGAHTLLSSPLFRPPSPEEIRRGRPLRGAGAALGTNLQQHGPVGPFGPGNPDWKHCELAKKSGTADFDSAHVYLARWAKIVAEEGENNRRREQEARQGQGPSQQQQQIQQPSPQPSSAAGFPMLESDVGSFEVWTRTPWSDRPPSTRAKNHPLTDKEWASCFYADGTPVLPWCEVKAKIFERGFGGEAVVADSHSAKHWDEMGPRAEAWSFLLGAQEWSANLNREARRQRWHKNIDSYWSTKAAWAKMLDPKAQAMLLDGDEASQEQYDFFCDEQHKIRVDCLRVDKRLPYFSESRDQLQSGAGHPSDNAHIQRLEDVLLTFVAWDRAQDSRSTSAEEHQPLGGYVQGMSDLCAPLYVLCRGDEVKTFWLFVGLMKRARQNFYADQSGMKMQLLALQKLIVVLDPGLHKHLESLEALNLFFCFRWLLVCFKREFEFPDILRLWEAIWAAALDGDEDGWQPEPRNGLEGTHDAKDDPLHNGAAAAADAMSARHRRVTSSSDMVKIKPQSPTSLSDHFAIFIAFAVLEQQRDVVVKYLHHFDEILQYMNGLSGQLDVDAVIAEAQVACLSLRNLVALQRGEAQPIGSADVARPDKGAVEVLEATTDKSARLQRQQIAAALPPVDKELTELIGEDAL